MLSRTADSLYWLSRYVERAENLARIIDVAQRLAGLPSAYSGSSGEWESAIATAGVVNEFNAVYSRTSRENVIEFLVASQHNPSSIIRCIETARQNARAVRTAMTADMWDIINSAWHEVQRVKPKSMTANELSQFLAYIQQVSSRFDGAAFRTMLRTDHFRFQRVGTYIERADNIARLLDVKYHVLLPDNAPVGGGLDYFQWSAILRAVGGLTSYHWVYRENVRPWLVADFLILRMEQPRSLISSYEALNRNLDLLAEGYGRQGRSQRLARATFAQLQNLDIDELFQSGLHEFITSFIGDNNRLGAAIAEQYLV